MRVYANLISNLALFDLPATKYDQNQNRALRYKIFRQLLVYDHLPDDDYDSVLREAEMISSGPDYSFREFFSEDYRKFIGQRLHHARWQKISKDYNHYTEWEEKRRNKDNPYYPTEPEIYEAWLGLPDLKKEKKNKPYQFDLLYKNVQILAGEVHELTKNYLKQKDRDLFRAKVNSILLPYKIVFALEGSDSGQDFLRSEMTVVNIKIGMDALKQAYRFLENVVESLHKMRWGYREYRSAIDGALELAEICRAQLLQKLKAYERNFMLYIQADLDE